MSDCTGELLSPSVTVPTALPQLVPSRSCLQCDVCCRFPDPDSALRPYFTGDEITRALAGGIEGTAFPDRGGSQVTLVSVPHGEGYLCPAFDSTTSQCRIYEQRPLDCQLYPLALMWNEAHDQILLGWDTKCPFMREEIPGEIQQHADRVMSLLNQPGIREELVAHPRLVGRFQEDVIVLAPLPDMTAAVAARWGTLSLQRLTVDDIPRLTIALDRSGFGGPQSPAAYSPVYHYMSNGLLAYWWMELHGALCLFAQSPDGWFMLLPPLGPGSIDAPLAAAMELLRRWNGGSSVSRVENVSARLVPEFERLRYRLTPKEPDYLYRATDLAALAGDRYKSQRALCNRFEREQTCEVGPYQLGDREGCRALLEDWSRQKQAEGLESFGVMLLADAESVHDVLWSHAPVLQIIGTVVRVQGRICAYTFGYWLTNTTFCVLLEVADRARPGLAQYLFRETCRMALSQGADAINTMDDAGLPGLRASKQAYHPALLIPNFVASPVRES
ncbi:MAG: phosphatidylglycerol lysyltransferase domain-containing protein [Nitrospirota bacterium]|nr:phosphatidylglycerol lysyltransferase domain-containing protein [Nitrospirota bacterium]MDP2382297.1 phosphatidylglycerol lysyltransferase domain-containing protein [Nitrospirota bacterium]MDP3599400.1 phosphatidylglycerol lysyltransferase domain-containing protein [Nitrospirota bacterium]